MAMSPADGSALDLPPFILRAAARPGRARTSAAAQGQHHSGRVVCQRETSSARWANAGRAKKATGSDAVTAKSTRSSASRHRLFPMRSPIPISALCRLCGRLSRHQTQIHSIGPGVTQIMTGPQNSFASSSLAATAITLQRNPNSAECICVRLRHTHGALYSQSTIPDRVLLGAYASKHVQASTLR
jgi:hypothetical protein